MQQLYGDMRMLTKKELLEATDWESLVVHDIDMAWQTWEREFMAVMYR